MTGKELARQIRLLLDALPDDERERVLEAAGWTRHSIRALERDCEPRASRIDALLTEMGRRLILGDPAGRPITVTPRVRRARSR